MKRLHNTLGTIALGISLPLAIHAQTTTTETSETVVSPDGTSTETTVTETRFTPEVRQQVIEFFERDPETPEEVADAIGVSRPLTTETLARGYVIAEEQRPALRVAPDDLVRVLPRLHGPDHEYFILGGNVVAINTENYTVIDSLQVPALAGAASTGAGAAATGITFTPLIETRVTEYFGQGVPPEISQRIKIDEVPETWVSNRIAPGYVIEDAHRTHLLEAPDDLVELLPALPGDNHDYYIMGGNVVAVNTRTHTVIDSIHVPAIAP